MLNNNYKSISDIVAKYLIFDLRKPEIQSILQNECGVFLSSKLEDPDDIQYLRVDFKFDKKGDMLTIIGGNLLSTLWLLGIYPPLPKRLKDKDIYTTKTKEYSFNSKTKKLTIIELYVNQEHNRNDKKNTGIS